MNTLGPKKQEKNEKPAPSEKTGVRSTLVSLWNSIKNAFWSVVARFKTLFGNKSVVPQSQTLSETPPKKAEPTLDSPTASPQLTEREARIEGWKENLRLYKVPDVDETSAILLEAVDILDKQEDKGLRAQLEHSEILLNSPGLVKPGAMRYDIHAKLKIELKRVKALLATVPSKQGAEKERDAQLADMEVGSRDVKIKQWNKNLVGLFDSATRPLTYVLEDMTKAFDLLNENNPSISKETRQQLETTLKNVELAIQGEQKSRTYTVVDVNYIISTAAILSSTLKEIRDKTAQTDTPPIAKPTEEAQNKPDLHPLENLEKRNNHFLHLWNELQKKGLLGKVSFPVSIDNLTRFAAQLIEKIKEQSKDVPSQNDEIDEILEATKKINRCIQIAEQALEKQQVATQTFHYPFAQSAYAKWDRPTQERKWAENLKKHEISQEDAKPIIRTMLEALDLLKAQKGNEELQKQLKSFSSMLEKDFHPKNSGFGEATRMLREKIDNIKKASPPGGIPPPTTISTTTPPEASMPAELLSEGDQRIKGWEENFKKLDEKIVVLLRDPMIRALNTLFKARHELSPGQKLDMKKVLMNSNLEELEWALSLPNIKFDVLGKQLRNLKSSLEDNKPRRAAWDHNLRKHGFTTASYNEIIKILEEALPILPIGEKEERVIAQFKRLEELLNMENADQGVLLDQAATLEEGLKNLKSAAPKPR